MSLGNHNQATKEKKKKENHKNNTGGLDWDINARRTQLYSTTQAGRIETLTQPHNSTPTQVCSVRNYSTQQ